MKPSEKPDFILLLGDIHPEALKPHLAELKIPIHATPGNHESDPETRALLYEMFPDDFKLQGKSSDYYSFVHKDVRFISVCDAGKGGEHIGQFCSENIRPTGQCEWLENELTCKEPRKVVFAHIPTERNGADKNMFLSRNDSRWFNALISAAQPTALFFGHLHKRTEEYQIGTTRVFQVRSCCWNFEKAPIGFLHVRMLPEGITVREVQTGEYR
jgi:Icc-related predicted phosphoesterase